MYVYNDLYKQDVIAAASSSKSPLDSAIVPVMATSSLPVVVTHSAPVQEKIKSELATISELAANLNRKRSLGYFTEMDAKELKHFEAKKQKLEKDLKTRVADQNRKKKLREDRKQVMQMIQTAHPATKSLLRIHETVGRPRIETENSGLLDAILDIAGHGAAADSRRRTETFRTVKTLKELKMKLEEVGFSIKESNLYLRLLPRRTNSTEGKRHVVTVPVKLAKPDNSLHCVPFGAESSLLFKSR